MMFNLEITLKAYRIEYYDYYDKEDKLLNFEYVKKVLKVHNDYGGAKFGDIPQKWIAGLNNKII